MRDRLSYYSCHTNLHEMVLHKLIRNTNPSQDHLPMQEARRLKALCGMRLAGSQKPAVALKLGFLFEVGRIVVVPAVWLPAAMHESWW